MELIKAYRIDIKNNIKTLEIFISIDFIFKNNIFL